MVANVCPSDLGIPPAWQEGVVRIHLADGALGLRQEGRRSIAEARNVPSGTIPTDGQGRRWICGRADVAKEGALAMFRSFFMAGFECATGYNSNNHWIDQIAATGHDRYLIEDYRRLK